MNIAVVGPGIDASTNDVKLARRIGKLIANEGWILLTGGMDGVMEAASQDGWSPLPPPPRWPAKHPIESAVTPREQDDPWYRSRVRTPERAARIWRVVRVGCVAALFVPLPLLVLPSAATALASTLITVSGQVVSADGTAVPNATVTWFFLNESASTSTDAQGDFTLSGVPPGEETLDVSDPNDEDLAQIPGGLDANTVLELTADTSGLVMTLPPTTTATVTVEDSGGNPVPGTFVELETPQGSGSDGPSCGVDYVLIPGGTQTYCSHSLGSAVSTSADTNGQAQFALVDDPDYQFQAYALDPTNPGREALSAPLTADGDPTVTLTLPDVPSPPQQLAAVGGTDSAFLQWSPPATDGGSALTGYTITATATAGSGIERAAAHSLGGSSIVETVSPTTTSAELTGLTAGTSYTVSVVATNLVGNSPDESTTVTALQPATVDMTTSVAVPVVGQSVSIKFKVHGIARGATPTGTVTVYEGTSLVGSVRSIWRKEPRL